MLNKYVYVIAQVGVKFGINFTSVVYSGKIVDLGKASAIRQSQCYLTLSLT